MGAFYLYRASSGAFTEKAQVVFSRKGFLVPEAFVLGEWRLLLFRKILLEQDNYVSGPDGSSVFCCGTVIYRGLGYRDSLARLLADFRNGTLDRGELLGNFVILFWDGQALSLLADAINAQRVFVNASADCLSSSFLAMVASSPTSLRLNHLAALEKLATGYIVSPDTLVDGILQLNHDMCPWLQEKSGIKVINNRPPEFPGGIHKQGFNESINCQLTVLESYIHSVDALAREFHAELGLSSGFDSRLLLGLSQFLSTRIPLHSHHTLNVHELELAIARQLAAVGGNEMTVVATARIEEQDEEHLRAVINDCLYFFDARCIHDMGSCSETYTVGYRKKILQENRLSLNGLGGEIYRNVYATPRGRFCLNHWMDYVDFFPFAREVCGSADAFHEMRRHKNEKMSRRLGRDLSGTVDFHTARGYYGLVRMPDCASNVSNAYNQVAFLLTPFIERVTLEEALKATPYIGADGQYEAAMIRQLSPRLASVPSQYGFPFSAIPVRHILVSELMSVIPLSVRRARARWISGHPGRNPDCAKYQQLRGRSRFIQEIEEALRDTFPHANWDMATREHTQKCTSISVGSFLLEFRHNLKR
ncbi:MAG: hypothetical protein NT167_30235 [Verrucomicrobia bacterium]|nr:hypothetical protein [Verrucomicrobiota bacterium]